MSGKTKDEGYGNTLANRRTSSTRRESLRDLSESELWERAGQVERLSLLALHSSQTRPEEGVSSSSGSTQAPSREVIDVISYIFQHRDN